MLPSRPKLSRPGGYRIGIEAPGIIEPTGRAIQDRPIGERAVFSSSMQPKGGVWEEFTAVPEQALNPTPAELEFIQAAALPVARSTALESLRTLGVKAGD